jgi:hypothetical protein
VGELHVLDDIGCAVDAFSVVLNASEVTTLAKLEL